jgi:hypothetical protein
MTNGTFLPTCIKEGFILGFHVTQDRIPTIGVVDGVSKARGIDNGQGQIHSALLFNMNSVSGVCGFRIKALGFRSRSGLGASSTCGQEQKSINE